MDYNEGLAICWRTDS